MSKKTQKPMTPRQIAYKQLSRKFKDPEPNDKYLLYRIVDAAGIGFAWKIYNQVQKIEAAGGIMTADGTRRRTPFGIFCHLATRQMKPQQLRRLDMSLSQLKVFIAEQRMIRKIRRAIAEAEGPLVIATPVVEPEIIEVVQPPAPKVVARQPEAPKQKNEKKTMPAARNKRDLAASRQALFQMDASDLLDVRHDLPPNVKAKLQQLQGASNVLRERVQHLESKPQRVSRPSEMGHQ
jgi:hypothetical protein